MNEPQRDPENPSHIEPRRKWCEQHLEGWREDSNGSNWGGARCKIHEDGKASLRVNLATGGCKCLAGGCAWQGNINDYAKKVGLATHGLPSFEREDKHEEKKKRGRPSNLGTAIAWYPYERERGKPIYRQVRYDPKDFRLQWWDAKTSSWKWGRNGLGLIPYLLPDVLEAEPSEPVWWVEGEKDAENAKKAGLVATTTPQGVLSFRYVDKSTLEAFRGRWVVIVPDNDPPGRDYALMVAEALHNIAKLILILTLPDVPPKGDLSDWLSNPKNTPEKLYALLDSSHCEEWRTSMLPRQEIETNDRELHDLSNEALGELLKWNDPPVLFTDLAGQLVRIQRIKSETNVQPVPSEALRGYLSESARWMKWKKSSGLVPTFPDTAVATDISLRHADRFPILEEFSRAPIFDENFRLIERAGYDKKTMLYADLGDLKLPKKVPMEPSESDLAEAKELLLGKMLGDFPFVDEASRAHSLAACLAPFVRQALQGPIPLHLIESPTPGSGKSLLASIVAIPATGSLPSAMSDAGGDEPEWRKRITSTLLKMPSYIFIDNINSNLDSDILAGAITARWWEDRMMGVSRNIRIPQRACWLATGNNLHVKLDLVRRTAWIRIDPKCGDPWNRDDFQIPDIITWTFEHRPQLVWACLVLVRYWLAAGQPRGKRKMGSFEGYARVIGGILDACGIPGFLENYEANFKRSDTASEEWEAFVAAWWEKFAHRPRTVSELAEFMQAEELLESVVPAGKNPAGRRVSLGKKLQGQIDRIYDGKMIVLHTMRNGAGCREYHVRRVGREDDPRTLPPEPLTTTELNQQLAEAAAASSEGALF